MKVISSTGVKGGSGKSSVALLLAWELAKDGRGRVAIIDTDAQCSSLSAKALNPQAPFDVVAATSAQDLWRIGKKMEEQHFDFLIVDGNPRAFVSDPDLVTTVAKLSDLNLIVSRPGPRDLKPQIPFVETIRKHTAGHIRLLWNFFQKNTNSHREGAVEGEKLLGLKSLETRIGLRIVYQDWGYVEGYIGDMGNADAADEVCRLGTEVRGVLDGQKTEAR
jgi:cellulose biosynthesis protein BcsQ